MDTEERLDKIDEAKEMLEKAKAELREALSGLDIDKPIGRSLKKAADETISEFEEAIGKALSSLSLAATNVIRLHARLKEQPAEKGLKEEAGQIDPASVYINVYVPKKNANFLYSEYASRTLNGIFDVSDWEDPDGVYLTLDGWEAMKIVKELVLSRDDVYWRQQKILTELIDDIDDKLEEKGIIRVNGNGDAEFMDASKKPFAFPEED